MAPSFAPGSLACRLAGQTPARPAASVCVVAPSFAPCSLACRLAGQTPARPAASVCVKKRQTRTCRHAFAFEQPAPRHFVPGIVKLTIGLQGDTPPVCVTHCAAK